GLADKCEVQVSYAIGVARPVSVFIETFGNDRLEIVYRGRIDDQYEPGARRSEPERADLRIAIEELLAGKSVTIAETPVEGCLIGRADAAMSNRDVTYTYHRDVVPVLNRNCVECHRRGQIGPFPMDSYRRVSGWADMMLETIEENRMPPWHADPSVGHFQNERRMPESDKRVLFEWFEAGMPEGDAADAPPPPNFADGWQLGSEPDQVVAMRDYPFVVPKEGTVDYQYFVTDPGFTEDRWVRIAEVIPGDRSVVHHCIVFVRPPDGGNFRGSSILTAYVPGQRLLMPPAHYARRVEAGSKLVFQMHYTPNGREAEDLTRIGLLFADEAEVTHEVFSLAALEHGFEIPPHEASYQVGAALRRLPPSGELLSISPHMHYRGKAFDVFIEDNRDRALLKVPRYDFNWQHSYIFKKPISLSEIDHISFEATFDNSAANPFNPDPEQWVTWGDQTWEEMALAFFEVALPRGERNVRAPRASPEAAEQSEIDAYIERCFAEMDSNGDGVIKRKEAPAAARLRWFRIVDQNDDNRITRVELRERGLIR
ncbi:MAG: methionine adenosyltransferase domain-containing protein, partial [Verrucomicrobiota bacterium]